MKNRVLCVSLIALSVLCLSVFAFGLTSSALVEEVYAAAPAGYVLASSGVFYQNVEYYIDTTVEPWSAPSDLSEVYPFLGTDGTNYFGVMAPSDYDVEFRIGNWDDGRWISNTIVDGVIVGYPLLNIHLAYPVPYLYVKQSAPSPVTQSLSITFDSGVSSVSLGNQTWSSSGSSNSVVFNDEDSTYTFNVTLNNAVLRSVTYNLSSDTTVGGILNATISGSSFTCECPVGDSIESITIYTDPLIYSSPCVITFDEYIQKIECDGIEWTASGQSNDIYYDLTSGSMSLTFDVTLNNGYIVDDYSIRMTGGLMTSSLNGNQLTVSGISSSGDSIQSISFTSEFLTVGIVSYVQTWSPNVDGDYTGQINYDGVSGTSVLPSFSLSYSDEPFSNYLELWDYVLSLIDTPLLLMNVRQYECVGVRYFDDSRVSFPLSAVSYDGSKGGLVFLTRRKTSKVSFSQPATFGYIPSSEIIDGKFPFNSVYQYQNDINYYVPPYLLSNGWSIVTPMRDYDLLEGDLTPVVVFIDGVQIMTFDCPVYRGKEFTNVSMAVYLQSVSEYLYQMTLENQVFYYPNSVFIYDNVGQNDYIEIYFTSGRSNWQPSIGFTFDFLGDIIDRTLDLLDVHITADITLKSIFLAVLALGVLLFLFRVSGVF